MMHGGGARYLDPATALHPVDKRHLALACASWESFTHNGKVQVQPVNYTALHLHPVKTLDTKRKPGTKKETPTDSSQGINPTPTLQEHLIMVMANREMVCATETL